MSIKANFLMLKIVFINPVSSIFVMFIAISFMIGSYELMALMIGLIIGKLIR